MLVARYVGDRTVAVAQAEPRPPGPGEIQISVAYTGLCGTDLHIVHGSMDSRVQRPLVFGHEMSGTVAVVGQGATGWTPGDSVTVMPLDPDGTCPACLAGNSHVCHNLNFIGIDSPGSLQPLWNVPAETVVRLPEGLRLDHAALAEPVAVAVHDVRRADLRPEDKTVVIGGGPIGVLVAAVARELGGDVVVAEIDPNRRHQVEQLGFTALDPDSTDLAAWVRDWSAGAGADVVFEVSGAPSAVLACTDLAKVRGTVVIVAIHPSPREMNLQRVFWRELTILGARVYERRDFDTAVELLARGAVPAQELITTIMPLSKTQEAFADLEAGRAMKILIDVGSQQ